MYANTTTPSAGAPPGAESGETAAGDFKVFLAGLRDKDRTNVQRHVAFCEALDNPAHARLWKRLACALASLAPHAIQTTGNRAVQFFAADGAYRVQVFALEDPRDGTLLLYTPDVMDAAVAAGVFTRQAGDNPLDGPRVFPVGGEPGAGLLVEVLTATQTTAAPDFYRHMLGWNRRALRVRLPATASAAQVDAAEALCRLAVRRPADEPAIPSA